MIDNQHFDNPEGYDVSMFYSGDKVTIDHLLKKNTLAGMLANNRSAVFYGSVSVRGTVYRKTEIIRHEETFDTNPDSGAGNVIATQEIQIPGFKWRPEVASSAGVCLMKTESVPVEKARDISKHLSDKKKGTLLLPKYSRIAFSGWKRFFSISDKLCICTNTEIEKNVVKITTSLDERFQITLSLHKELYIKVAGSRKNTRAQIICTALATALKKLRRTYLNANSTHSEEDAGSFSLEEGLCEFLVSNKIPTWKEDNFDPSHAATLLYKASMAGSKKSRPKKQYKRLNREKVNVWVKRLLIKEVWNQRKRKTFLQHVLDNDHNNLVDFVESSIAYGSDSAYSGDGTLPSLDGQNKDAIQLTAGHMYLMPASDIATLYKHWQCIPDEEAADSCLWGAITLSEIRAKRIKPSWLAVDNSCDESKAMADLDQAIKDSDFDAKKTDRMIRRVLRWMMGPGHMRGPAELYGNCSLAKAWWCGRLAYQISEQYEVVDFENSTKLLQGSWPGLADYLAGRWTIICEPNVLCGLLLWLQRRKGNSAIHRVELEQTISRLFEISSWSVLEAQSPFEIADTIESIAP